MQIPLEITKNSKNNLTGLKSGALIISCYLLQGVCGLLITGLLALTLRPDLFAAAGLLPPMGFGQGPGQANNIGASYEALGFVGGQSFGLSIAACGFLVACVAGVIYLNILQRHGKIQRLSTEETVSGSVSIDMFESRNEFSVS